MVPNRPPRDDNPEWMEEDFSRARPASEVVGAKAAAALVRKGGRPPKPAEERKQQVTMRFAPDLLEAMRATGSGWQTRAEAVLRREFIDAEVEAVAAAMRSTLEGRQDFDIHFDEQVRRGFEKHSSFVVHLAIEKLKAEKVQPKRLSDERSTLFDRMANIARTAASAASGSSMTVARSAASGRVIGRSKQTERKKRA